MSEVIWCDRGWQPVKWGFCPTKEAWDAEMKRMDYDEDWPLDKAAAMVTQLEDGAVLLVTCRPEYDEEPTLGLLVHEAVHVWQFMCERMHEDAPGDEIEAYSIQHIFLELKKAMAKSKEVSHEQA